MNIATYLEFFLLTLDNHNLVVLLIDTSSKQIIKVNKKACEFYGYTMEELETMKISDINILPEAIINEKMAQAIKLEVNCFEFRHKKKDGSIAEVISNSSSIVLDRTVYLLSFVQDISQRVEYEKKLAVEKEWFETIFEVANTGIVIIDRATYNVTGLNKKALAMIKAEKTDIIGKPCNATLCSPNNNCQTNGAGSQICNEERYIELQDGERIPVLKSIIEKEIGGKAFLIESFVDISQRMKALEALQTSEEKWKFAIESSGDGLWDWNLESNEVFFSPLWKSMLGYEENELHNELKEWEIRVHPDDLEKAYGDINSHITGKTGYYSSEYRLRCKDGSYKWIWDRGKIIEYTYDGKPKRMIGTHRDISDIMLAEKRLKEKTEELESYFNNGLDLLCISDRNGFFYRLNPEWEKVLGYRIDELTGHQYLEFVHPDDIESTKRVLRNLNSGEEVLNFVNRYRRKDGNYCWIEWRSRIVGVMVYVSARDITKRIQAERETEELLFQVAHQKDLIEQSLFDKNLLIDSLEKTKLEHENTIKEKDKFFSILAHDLKSPFSGFLGLIKVITEDIYDLSIRDMEKYMVAIKQSAENLYKLLENLLEWSRINRGLVQFEPDYVDLSYIVSNNTEILNSRISIKDIAVEVEVKDSLTVFADTNMLNAIIRNLLSNAVKFTTKGGKIVISAVETGGDTEISISDSGIGIPEDMIPKLFSVGERTSRPGTDGESSSGLGLLLCKEYVEKHNGFIKVESKVNQGTTFRFTIPKKYTPII